MPSSPPSGSGKKPWRWAPGLSFLWECKGSDPHARRKGLDPQAPTAKPATGDPKGLTPFSPHRLLEVVGGLVPVHGVPPHVDVGAALVLVLQVVGVLPNVDAN